MENYKNTQRRIIVVEGEPKPGDLANVTHYLRRLGHEVTVHILTPGSEYEIGEVTLFKDDFYVVWNSGGAGKAWSRLIKVADEREDFPMRKVEEESSGATSLVGNIEEAMDWLKANPLTKGGESVTDTVLRRIYAKIQAETNI